MRRAAPATKLLTVLSVLALALAPEAFGQYDAGGSPEADDGAEKDGAPPAGDDDDGKLWSPKPRGEYPMGERTARWVGEAYTAIGDEKLEEARAALANLRLAALNPLERATAYQAYAYIAYGEEDLPGAIDYLEKAIAESALPEDVALDMRFQIAQLHLALEAWQEVVDNLKLWFSLTPEANSSAHYLLALAYFQMEDFQAALAPASRAVELSEDPQESWLQLLLAIRLTRKDYRESIPVIEELVRRYPKKSYWIQLSTVHGALGDFEEALIPLQLAYEQGLLSEDEELRRLGQLLLFLELPYRAARVLDRGLEQERIKPDPDVYEMLSNAWIAAREFEKAVDPLEKAAAISEKGDTYVRLAQVQLQREKWGAAVEALERAFEKGDVSKPGQAWLLLGIARYSRQQPLQAIRSFERAREFEDVRDEANNWLAHIERELQPAS